jgi:hypothetical protein
VILSRTENRQILEAALTSMLQKDTNIVGSIVEIRSYSHRIRRENQDLSSSTNISFDLDIISSKPCTSSICAAQFQSNTYSLLIDINQTNFARLGYQQENTTINHWLTYHLPETIQSSSIHFLCWHEHISILFSFVSVDLFDPRCILYLC